MPKKDRAKLNKVSINLPFGIGGAEWVADPAERRAAWALYVELVTRVAVQPLGKDEGVLRESLSSLHALFAVTRQVLRDAGPDVGIAKESVGGAAIAVLNQGLRPFLARWHPALQAWEAQRDPKTSLPEHERKWSEEPKLRAELENLRKGLAQYADALAKIAGVDG
jgi:hypothetical protein